ncbi:TPA: 4-hydroxy-3-methylbut-2-en-1-yl diphosphate synthase, partial [bacterium]|nr:4-hydroxy-3-methylbut-2-en-1-yl diphosphate synthase [bacterium]
MRRKSREVGSLGIGGSNPIRIQSMTTLPATDVEGSVEECRRLYNAGCELIRISTPRVADASAL